MPETRFAAGPVDGIPDGGMREVTVDGAKVLLSRDGPVVHAVAGVCPHAGAPLAQGVRSGGRVVCQWHKAAFCLRTGAVLEPPAVDPLDRYDVTVEAGDVWLSRAAPPPAAEAPPDGRCFVILGGGAAGAVAAQTLRAEGFGGRIVMLDRENRVPYDRTVLSKYALSGEKGGEKSPLQSQAFYRQQRIERRTGEVVRLDAVARRVTCADGFAIGYDAALLATGSEPKPAGWPGVFTLRSRADAEAILAQAERSERAVVLGASFIGMEVAASLRERGLDVTVVAKEDVPFARQLGPRIGAALRTLHEGKGVRFRLACGVAAVDGTGVTLEGGEHLPAELVVAGHGVVPVTGFLAGVPRDADGGVTVDAHLRLADGLYAAGDAARFPLGGDGPPTRVEHWRVAEQHGRVAALNMLGRPVRFTGTPVFWTIQYRKRVDYIGHAADWDDVVIHGDLEAPAFLAYFVKDGRVVAAAGMDRDRDTAALVELFDRRGGWTAAELGEHPVALL